MSMVSPVIKPSYSEARKATARATSYGFPDRPSGMDEMVFKADSFVVWVSWNLVPSINPGATVFTLILSDESSFERDLVHVRTAPLHVE